MSVYSIKDSVTGHVLCIVPHPTEKKIMVVRWEDEKSATRSKITLLISSALAEEELLAEPTEGRAAACILRELFPDKKFNPARLTLICHQDHTAPGQLVIQDAHESRTEH